jgi:hypothetical protein
MKKCLEAVKICDAKVPKNSESNKYEEACKQLNKCKSACMQSKKYHVLLSKHMTTNMPAKQSK